MKSHFLEENYIMNKKIISVALCAAMCLGTGCESRGKIEPVDGWYSTWTAASIDLESEQLPRNGLKNNTCRQQFRVSVGGDKIRLTFSNEYGATPLEISGVRIAKLKNSGSPEIDVATDTAVTFGNAEGVLIPAGETMTSDEISFSFDSLEFLSVSILFGDKVPATVTGHREADCTSWFVEGNHIVDDSFDSVELMWSYYFLTRADTWAPAGTETLVCFGDSITDGACSTFNGFNSWPDNLSAALQSDPATQHISVVNTAIAGGALMSGGWGEPGIERFERDVLNIPGVHHVIILLGTNDIPGAQYDTSEDFIDTYKKMIKMCHEKGISVYAGTITPFGNSEMWYSELHEKIRTTVNEWMMSDSSGFDGFVDFAGVTCYAENPQTLQTIYDSGDGLHPNSNGYDVMGKAAAEAMKDKLSKTSK